MRRESLRVLLYSHNGVGVGHFRRQLHLAAALRRRRPDAAILLVTGSHAAGALSGPLGFDFVSLPSIRMVDRYEAWEPRQPGLSIREVIRMRADLLRRTVRRFRPDFLLADFMPAGPYGELLGALKELAECGGRAVAGFRDIIDEPEFVRGLWSRTGVYDVLRDHYAAILVYGVPEVMDFVADYGIDQDLSTRLHYVGYLGRSAPPYLRTDPDSPPAILACTGGGVDGGTLLETFIRAARKLQPQLGSQTVVGGPLLSPPELRRLRALAQGLPITVRRFVSDLGETVTSSDVVVTMPGYNTICELLSGRARAVVVPRAGPSREQRMRAEWLESWGGARALEPLTLNVERLADAIQVGLVQPPPPRPPVPLSGLDRAAAFIEMLAPEPASWAAR
jgi:predicted glycosyltransferase